MVLYEEMYNAAFNQTNLILADTVALHANQFYVDTIPLGVIDYRYVHFPQNILDIHLDEYYFCDEESNRLLENGGDMSLLHEAEVFMVSPLQRATRTLNPTFVVDMAFIFADPDFINQGNKWEAEVDFGDGNGFQHIYANSCITIHYHHPGVYQITTRVEIDGNLKTSVSELTVTDNIPNIDCAYYADPSNIDGLRTFRFDPNCPTDKDKLIFILAGYNVKSFINHGIRTPEELYIKYVQKGLLEPLRDFGYTFIIVDYADHNAPIETNALLVARLLSYYRCHQRGEEQFVVIGQSMGCLIGRYALTYLEHHPSRFSDCEIPKLHNTRLFISNDGPHQGVNIPLSLQCLYGSILDNNAVLDYLIEKLNANSRLNINLSTTLLRGESVKQMLYYHYATDSNKNGLYTADPKHYQFLQDMVALGDYPQYCKTVALSNGSIEGYPQQNYFSKDKAGNFRIAGDHLLLMHAGFGVTVLGMRFDDVFNIDLRTNDPNSNTLGSVSCEHRFALIGLLSGRIYFSSDIDVKRINYPNATHLLPYCVSAGGNEYAYSFGFDTDFPALGICVDLGIVGAGVSMGDGRIEVGARLGIPWLLDASVYGGIRTDGLGFGFVPVQSAFDFRRGQAALDVNFNELPVTSIFNETPFDAIIGRTKGVGVFGEMPDFTNFNHEDVYNHTIINQQNDVSDKTKINSYTTTDSICRILAREIGDEELYLNNAYLPYHAEYSAALNIYVQRDYDAQKAVNPYFKSNDHPTSKIVVPGAFMRTGNWGCVSSARPSFYFSNNLIIDNEDFQIGKKEGYENPCLHQKKEKPQSNAIEWVSLSDIKLYSIDGHLMGTYSSLEQVKENLSILPMGAYISVGTNEQGNKILYKFLTH